MLIACSTNMKETNSETEEFEVPIKQAAQIDFDKIEPVVYEYSDTAVTQILNLKWINDTAVFAEVELRKNRGGVDNIATVLIDKNRQLGVETYEDEEGIAIPMNQFVLDDSEGIKNPANLGMMIKISLDKEIAVLDYIYTDGTDEYVTDKKMKKK